MADGRHNENRYDVITVPRMIRIRWNLVYRLKTTCRWGSNSKPEVKFQYCGRLFLETGSSNMTNISIGRGLRYLVEIWYADTFRPT